MSYTGRESKEKLRRRFSADLHIEEFQKTFSEDDERRFQVNMAMTAPTAIDVVVAWRTDDDTLLFRHLGVYASITQAAVAITEAAVYFAANSAANEFYTDPEKIRPTCSASGPRQPRFPNISQRTTNAAVTSSRFPS